jgi:hypothetical protein
MAYTNFKPIIWSKFIQTELEKKCKLVEDCWTQFQGEAKRGATVRILGVGGVTIGDYSQNDGIGDPETPADSFIDLPIDQAKYFNFMVDDIDKAQAVTGVMETIMKEAVSRMARTRDSFVAGIAKDAASTMTSQSLKIAGSGSGTVTAKAAIDAGLLALRENDVDIEDEVVITVSPFVYQLFRDDLTELKTNNDELIRKGIVGMYDNCVVKVSNNLYNDGTDDYCMIRSKRAIAFAGGIDETEAYRPDKFFADAVRGLNVYGAKLIRPKELYVVKAHK